MNLSLLMDIAEVTAGFSAGLALILAVLGAFYARSQVIENREAGALDAFLDYMKTVLQYHDYDEPDYSAISTNQRRHTEYRRFVGYALTACERVLLYSRGQNYWHQTVCSHVRRHREYIKTDIFKNYIDHFSPEMRTIINQVRSEQDGSQPDPVSEADFRVDSTNKNAAS